MIVKNIATKDHIDFSDTFLKDIINAGQSFRSKILLKRNNAVADCRSILEVLLLGAVESDNMEIVADGDDETAAAELVSGIFLDGAGI